jgi:hypothetical protein
MPVSVRLEVCQRLLGQTAVVEVQVLLQQEGNVRENVLRNVLQERALL